MTSALDILERARSAWERAGRPGPWADQLTLTTETERGTTGASPLSKGMKRPLVPETTGVDSAGSIESPLSRPRSVSADGGAADDKRTGEIVVEGYESLHDKIYDPEGKEADVRLWGWGWIRSPLDKPGSLPPVDKPLRLGSGEPDRHKRRTTRVWEGREVRITITTDGPIVPAAVTYKGEVLIPVAVRSSGFRVPRLRMLRSWNRRSGPPESLC